MRAEPNSHGWSVERIDRPSVAWFRDIYRRIGTDLLWFMRLRMSEAQLADLLAEPGREFYALRVNACDEGLIELKFVSDTCDLAFFGVTPPLLGSGAGRVLMNRAIDLAWSRPIQRFIVNTCTFDHPRALPFYMRTGFVPTRRQIELVDDPRLDDVLPRDAAPQVPIIEP
jgi:GNAT superfamily N-acetyltransferase